VTIYRIIDLLGAGCKDPVQVANELHPMWSGILGCDGKVIKVAGEERIFLAAVDVGTQDVADWRFSKHEDYLGIRALLKEVRDEVQYQPKMIVIDLDPAWKEAVQRVFPGVPRYALYTLRELSTG
jgi:transposase-like protein